MSTTQRATRKRRSKRFADVQETATFGLFAIAVLVPFMIFAVSGWPGEPDPCVYATRNTCTDANLDPANAEVCDEQAINECFCEAFDEEDIGDPGLIQPQNTLSNLYALFTGAIVAAFAQSARQKRSALSPRMCGGQPYPLLYICAVTFLGLGSMYFHASMVKWGGVLDNLSMYTFANFVLCYTLARIADSDKLFWLSYIVLTVSFTFINATELVSSFGFILAIFVFYIVLEIYIAAWEPKKRASWQTYVYFHMPAMVSFAVAVIVWMMSQTGKAWCSPNGFQGHVIWHILAGVSATLLYFYWRDSPS